MRLSQLLGKRIINIYDGEIMGLVGDSDLVVNPELFCRFVRPAATRAAGCCGARTNIF